VPGDPTTLAAAIEAVLELPADQREALGHRARAAVLRRCTVAEMQRATLDVYQQVMALA
jgi:hypothetical protein